MQSQFSSICMGLLQGTLQVAPPLEVGLQQSLTAGHNPTHAALPRTATFPAYRQNTVRVKQAPTTLPRRSTDWCTPHTCCTGMGCYLLRLQAKHSKRQAGTYNTSTQLHCWSTPHTCCTGMGCYLPRLQTRHHTSAVSTTACNVADQLLLMVTELTMQNHHGLPDCLLSV